MLKIYIIGVCILFIAIVANAAIVKMGIKSWYDFIAMLNEFGSNTLGKLSIIDYAWLFIGYPLVLGLGYWCGLKLYQLIL